MKGTHTVVCVCVCSTHPWDGEGQTEVLPSLQSEAPGGRTSQGDTVAAAHDSPRDRTTDSSHLIVHESTLIGNQFNKRQIPHWQNKYFKHKREYKGKEEKEKEHVKFYTPVHNWCTAKNLHLEMITIFTAENCKQHILLNLNRGIQLMNLN